MKGRVKRFNEFRGWGFITGEDSQDYFVHFSFIKGDGYKYLKANEEVLFDPVESNNGLRAYNVRTIEERLRGRMLKHNPFTPQQPVTDPDKFAGRSDSIRNAVDSIFNSKNIIITGDRGIGKSSLAYQLSYLAQGEQKLLDRLCIDTGGFEFQYLVGDHRCVPGNSLDEVLSSLLNSFIRGAGLDGSLNNISTELGIDLSFFKISFKENANEPKITEQARTFTSAIEKIYNLGRVDFNGILFLIDEIDTLGEDINIGSFFKAVTEELKYNGYNNISFVVAGVTGVMTNLIVQHKSVSRLFENINLKLMSDEELSRIIKSSLSGTGVDIDENTLNEIVKMSQSYPEPVHLIGYHTFRLDTDNKLSQDDLDSAMAFIVKELKHQEFSDLYSMASADLGKQILEYIAKSIKSEFTIRDVLGNVTAPERQLAYKMGDLTSSGLLIRPRKGVFKLKDPLFKVYLRWVFKL